MCSVCLLLCAVVCLYVSKHGFTTDTVNLKNERAFARLHYINYMLLVVPSTEAVLPCWSAMDTLR